MNLTFRSISCCLGLGIAAFGASQVKAVGSGYLFRLHLTEGEHVRYVAPVKIEGLLKEPIKLRLKMDIAVLQVRHGKFRIRGRLDSGKYKGAQILPTRKVSFEVDQRGRVSDASQALGGFTVVFPEFPVRVGGAFVAPVPVLVGGEASGPQVGSRDATFRFVGFVGKGKHRSAKLIFDVAGDLAPSGAMLINLADGVMEHYATKFYLGASRGKPLVVSAHFDRS